MQRSSVRAFDFSRIVPDRVLNGKAVSWSSGTASHRLDQFAQGLGEALKPFILDAMPLVVQRHLVRN